MEAATEKADLTDELLNKMEGNTSKEPIMRQDDDVETETVVLTTKSRKEFICICTYQ